MKSTPLPLTVVQMITVGALRRLGALDGRADLGVVVAVDLAHLPAESAPLLGQRLEAHDVLGAAVDHHVVAVDEGREVSTLKWCAAMAASHTVPSLHSPSPSRQ